MEVFDLVFSASRSRIFCSAACNWAFNASSSELGAGTVVDGDVVWLEGGDAVVGAGADVRFERLSRRGARVVLLEPQVIDSPLMKPAIMPG